MFRLRNVLLLIPISMRRSILKGSPRIPLWFSRLLFKMVTSPVGDEYKWIHPIEKLTWKGVWIAPNITSVKQAEDAALNNDLTILYTHGNAKNL